MTDDREIVGWGQVGPATRAPAEAVHADGWQPDVILAIARGRLLVADDVADTGLTLRTVHDFCGERVGEVRSAASATEA